MKKAIVTFNNNIDRYTVKQQRQEQSLKEIGWDGDYFCFHTFEEIGSPDHNVVPYAFKPYAIKKVKDMGYDVIVWMDSPVYATKPIHKVIEHIEFDGYLLFDNIGFTIGDFTSDVCLAIMDMTREQSFKENMIMACVIGFDFRNENTVKFFNEYYRLASVEGAYEGAWHNDMHQVSLDARCKGHRHDQSVASIYASKNQMKITHPHSTFFAYFNNPGHLPHSETVCLLSH